MFHGIFMIPQQLNEGKHVNSCFMGSFMGSFHGYIFQRIGGISHWIFWCLCSAKPRLGSWIFWIPDCKVDQLPFVDSWSSTLDYWGTSSNQVRTSFIDGQLSLGVPAWANHIFIYLPCWLLESETATVFGCLSFPATSCWREENPDGWLRSWMSKIKPASARWLYVLKLLKVSIGVQRIHFVEGVPRMIQMKTDVLHPVLRLEIIMKWFGHIGVRGFFIRTPNLHL